MYFIIIDDDCLGSVFFRDGCGLFNDGVFVTWVVGLCLFVTDVSGCRDIAVLTVSLTADALSTSLELSCLLFNKIDGCDSSFFQIWHQKR